VAVAGCIPSAGDLGSFLHCVCSRSSLHSATLLQSSNDVLHHSDLDCLPGSSAAVGSSSALARQDSAVT
jgi:hypothetical protein